jgi:PhzF family phenazine biosynthesis protein
MSRRKSSNAKARCNPLSLLADCGNLPDDDSVLRSGGVYEPAIRGEPRGRLRLAESLEDAAMQAIAAENNLPATAFLIDRGTHFDLRWMTPTVELDLCGHATLASAHVLFRHLGRSDAMIRFQSRSGELRVERAGDRLTLDFPAQRLNECQPPEKLAEGLGAQPSAVLKGNNYLAVFDHEVDIASLLPDFRIIADLDAHGVIATAPGDRCDFVSRYFAPRVGVPEDSATGSAHCALVPYWSKRLGKRTLHARQLSMRGGELFCEDRGERVGLGGNAVTYVEGQLHCA